MTNERVRENERAGIRAARSIIRSAISRAARTIIRSAISRYPLNHPTYDFCAQSEEFRIMITLATN
jgi:hypothetical protein